MGEKNNFLFHIILSSGSGMVKKLKRIKIYARNKNMLIT
jgi:hypothetical protein